MRLIKLVLVLIFLLVTLWGLQGLYGEDVTSSQTCQEDDPCWDCRTMGNLICGPLVTE